MAVSGSRKKVWRNGEGLAEDAARRNWGTRRLAPPGTPGTPGTATAAIDTTTTVAPTDLIVAVEGPVDGGSLPHRLRPPGGQGGEDQKRGPGPDRRADDIARCRRVTTERHEEEDHRHGNA